MVKKIVVHNCGLCPHAIHILAEGVFCDYTGIYKNIDEYYEEETIPDWCPLEDDV